MLGKPADKIATTDDIARSFSTAVEKGDKSEIKRYIAMCGNQGERRGRAAYKALLSMLLDAPRGKAAGLLDLLIACGMDPDLRNDQQFTLLSEVTSKNRIDLAALLLERRADVNAEGRDRLTPLHVLSDIPDQPPGNHRKWLDLFVKYKVDLNARSGGGYTLMCGIAASDAYHPLLVELVKRGADYNLGGDDGNAPLSLATQHAAIKNRNYLRSKDARLYSREFPVSNDSAACRAVLSGGPTAVRALPAKDFSALTARDSRLVPSTPLHLAVEKGDLGLLKALGDRGVNWNVPDRNGESPLHRAVQAERWDIIQVLMDGGADPNFADAAGLTPFMAACAANPPLALKFLSRGLTPHGKNLDRAVISSENIELVKALGETVPWDYDSLAYAAGIGQVEIFEFLAPRVNLKEQVISKLAARCRENRMKNGSFGAKFRKPLVVPRKTGGIAAKRGTFTYTVESWSPWLKSDKYKVSAYPVGIYVPPGYDGKKSFGLVISMTNAKSSSRFPRAFTRTLDRHNLIWAGFDPYNGITKYSWAANTPFCLAVLYQMLRYYNIDQNRIYIGGYSLGGQLTEIAVNTFPYLFDGAFFINIGYESPALSLHGQEFFYCKHHLPIALVEGDYDYNRESAYVRYSGLVGQGFTNIYYTHEPMKGHILIGPESFEKIIAWLDKKK